MKILFVSEHNACRAPLAAAITNHLAGNRVEAHSAGMDPEPLSEVAIAELEHLNLPVHHPVAGCFSEIELDQYDLVIGLCSRSASSCEQLSARPELIRWDEPETGKDHDIHQLVRELSDRIRLMLMAKHLI